MSKYFFPLALLALLACKSATVPVTGTYTVPERRTWHVNPFIGTGGHGHTYPGATTPFGLVQLSPDTRIEGWDGCGGYHYDDSLIYGFSHTHLQGTGVSDYADILFMPTNGRIRKADHWRDAIASKFSHDFEDAEPGYYAVLLQDYNLQVELSATTHTGIHRYTPLRGDSVTLFIDMAYRDDLHYYDIITHGDTAISGYRVSRAWAEEQHCYFYAVFSQPFSEPQQLEEVETQRDPETGERTDIVTMIQTFRLSFAPGPVTVRVGISGTDLEGAKKNLYAEAPHGHIEQYHAAASNAWEQCLSKVPITSTDNDERAIHYTALYHCYTVPNTWSDVDGRYRGMDNRIHQAEGYTRYTVFSLWDTFRAYHPLMAELEPERTRDFIVTFLEMYKERRELPVWELAANETYCMIGYHSVPVIVDAYFRGIRDFDHQLALEAMVAAAEGPQEEKLLYAAHGYVPGDRVSESVSKTLEFAYDDWCIAQFALALGDQATFERFIRRSQSWKNLYDPDSGFMRARRNGGFAPGFDPYQVDFNYTEANAWQYSLFVPHDMETLDRFIQSTRMIVGEDRPGLGIDFWLNNLFSAKQETTGREQADITGLIGQYAHGNEPSHHMALLYLHSKPERARELVQQIRKEMYRNAPDGLSGNEDCGQMSAWYVLTSMDKYPVCPGSRTMYNLKDTTPVPMTVVEEYPITPQPIVEGPATAFLGTATVRVKNALPGTTTTVKVYESSTGEDGKQVYRLAQQLTNPDSIVLAATSIVSAQASYPSCIDSRVETATFYQRNDKRHVIAHSGYDNQYTAGGDDALVDGMRGSNDFRTGQWQGYWRKKLEVTVDLGEEFPVRYLGLSCYQDIRPWIWMPSQVDFYVSADGVNFQLFGSERPATAPEQAGALTEEIGVHTTFERPAKYRYVKVVATPAFETIPSWHLGAGGQPWIFADELIIQ